MARWRNETLGLRLTTEEKEIIKARMAACGYKNATDFIMKCICTQAFINVDTRPLLGLKNEISRIGSNVNQIAKVANTSKSIHYDDVLELERNIDELRAIIHRAFYTCVKEKNSYGIHENNTDKN